MVPPQKTRLGTPASGSVRDKGKNRFNCRDNCRDKSTATPAAPNNLGAALLFFAASVLSLTFATKQGLSS
jgi:hypothetical protein